ncbi:MAG: beta-ketoacyl-ACP synthase II [Clostridia bacterium]
MRRVVITGIGMVTPLGISTEANWEAILAGRSGVGPITAFDASRIGSRIAGEVRGFDPATVLEQKEIRRLDRFMHFAMAATDEAWNDSDLVRNEELADRTGVIYGSGMGGLTTIFTASDTLREKGPSRVSPFLGVGSPINMAAGIISIRWGLRGPNYATVSACSTSGHAIADSYFAIQRGDADVMVTGGSEAVLTEVTIASFDNAGALSKRNDNPPAASRPFDAGRDGFVLAEGGATLILEELDHARRRSARIYAEIIGVGMAGDAYHVTAPTPEGTGAARAMARALETAGLRPEDVQYINAHATSTVLGDASETAAIKTVFGSAVKTVAVSSTKSMTGHMLGAAGATEAAYTALALFYQVLPPTINYDEPEPDLDLDYVPHRARPAEVSAALSNSNGFGGANITLAFRRCTDV